MKFLFALLIVIFTTGCDAYVEVPADMVGANPYSDIPVFIKMNAIQVSPFISENGSEPFTAKIKVPRPDPNDPSAIEDRTTAGFNFVNALTGDDLSAPVKCPIGGKIITHIVRRKTSSGEGVKCTITNYNLVVLEVILSP